MRKTFRKTRILLTLLIVGIIAGAAYAFTASNTVPASYAGDGAGTISGYTVSAIAYNLNATTVTNIDSVTFTLDHPATTVKATFESGATPPRYNCSVSGGTSVTCNTTSPQLTVANATNLDVLAVQ
jgi:hypothetical protein